MNPLKVEWAFEAWVYGACAVAALGFGSPPITVAAFAFLTGLAWGRIRERRKVDREWRRATSGGER